MLHSFFHFILYIILICAAFFITSGLSFIFYLNSYVLERNSAMLNIEVCLPEERLDRNPMVAGDGSLLRGILQLDGTALYEHA